MDNAVKTQRNNNRASTAAHDESSRDFLPFFQHNSCSIRESSVNPRKREGEMKYESDFSSRHASSQSVPQTQLKSDFR
jgi:hypothetical protein